MRKFIKILAPLQPCTVGRYFNGRQVEERVVLSRSWLTPSAWSGSTELWALLIPLIEPLRLEHTELSLHAQHTTRLTWLTIGNY